MIRINLSLEWFWVKYYFVIKVLWFGCEINQILIQTKDGERLHFSVTYKKSKGVTFYITGSTSTITVVIM